LKREKGDEIAADLSLVRNKVLLKEYAGIWAKQLHSKLSKPPNSVSSAWIYAMSRVPHWKNLKEAVEEMEAWDLTTKTLCDALDIPGGRYWAKATSTSAAPGNSDTPAAAIANVNASNSTVDEETLRAGAQYTDKRTSELEAKIQVQLGTLRQNMDEGMTDIKSKMGGQDKKLDTLIEMMAQQKVAPPQVTPQLTASQHAPQMQQAPHQQSARAPQQGYGQQAYGQSQFQQPQQWNNGYGNPGGTMALQMPQQQQPYYGPRPG